MQVDDRQLKAFLFEGGLVPRTELDRASKLALERDQPLTETLVQSGVLGDDEMRRTLGAMLGIPFVILESQPLHKESLMRLPEPMARTHNAIIVGVQGQKLEVVFLDTKDIKPVQDFFGSGWTVMPHLTNRASIKYALTQYQKILKELFGNRIAEELRSLERAHQIQDGRGSMEASVRAAEALLQHALHMKAREMHIEPSSQGLRIRYRLGSALYDSMQVPTHAAPFLGARFKSLANIPLTDVLGSGRFKMNAPMGGRNPEEAQNESVTVTVSTIPIILENGPAEKLLLSFVHERSGKNGFSLAALGAAPHTIESIQRLVSHASGLVLVSGVEGSGKTSMLYTLLDECADVSKHMASVEDTVSHVLPGVAQMEIDESVGLTASSCVRAQLKQHPDVLMIDCVLTEEVALLAAQAANRGSLVLLGVEATVAGEGIAQLLALGVEPELLAAVCVGSIGVHTISRLCTHKTLSYKPTRAEQTLLEETIDVKEVIAALKKEHSIDARTVWKDIELRRPIPCPQCEDGFAGLVGLQEVVTMSRTLKELVRAGADTFTLELQAKRDGSMTLAEDALYKGIQGVISADGVLQVAAGYQGRYE
ncbi:Flp pilus assembly complex ATPase component TadA [Patescibacteria group bacterium]|nr:Flp pilus assembly complex ATPase component TadA [Patescibacteria group bacterium]